MIRRYAPDVPAPVPTTPFTTPADVYTACPNRHARDLALETVVEALRLAPSPKTRTLNRSTSDDGSRPDETRLELPTGSVVRHHAWYRSFCGWVVEIDMTAGPHGDARFSISTGMREAPEAIMPTSATSDAARDAAILTLECLRLHLDLSMSRRADYDDEQAAHYLREAEWVAACAEPPVQDDCVYVLHPAPWATVRAIETEPDVDLLDEADRSSTSRGMTTRIQINAHAGGVGASVERLAQFVETPDPLERLRVLAATTRRAA
jgi:hypothetical protein